MKNVSGIFIHFPILEQKYTGFHNYNPRIQSIFPGFYLDLIHMHALSGATSSVKRPTGEAVEDTGNHQFVRFRDASFSHCWRRDGTAN